MMCTIESFLGPTDVLKCVCGLPIPAYALETAEREKKLGSRGMNVFYVCGCGREINVATMEEVKTC